MGVFEIMEFTHAFYEALPPEAAAIRQAVFVEEQGFQEEFDDVDCHALHLLLFADSAPVGTLRAFVSQAGEAWHIGRVAVLPAARGLHIGKRMMTLAEAELRRRGAKRIELSAQCRVQPFYEQCGYTPVGQVYLDEFCPHIRMVKELQ